MKAPQALPHLDGRRGTIARAVYLALAGLTLIAITGSLVFNGLDFFRNMPAAMQWGFRTYTSVGHPQIGETTPGAYAAGIRNGDRIVAIQGTTLAPRATEFHIGARLNAIEGDRLTLVTRRVDGNVGAHELPRLPDVWQRTDTASGLPLWLYSSATFFSMQIIPIFLLAASFLLYRRRPGDPEAMLFAIGFVLLSNLPDVDFWLTALFDVQNTAFNALVSTGWCAIFVAIAGFPDGRFVSRWAKGVVIAIAPVVYLSLMLSLTPAGGVPIVKALLAFATLLIVLATVVAVTRRFRALTAGPERQQIKWVVLGFCVTAISATIITFLPAPGVPALKGDAAYFLLFTILRLFVFLPLPLGLLVSLLRYRLYDAEATISRSAAYAVLTVSLVAIFAACEKVIEVLGEEYFRGSAGAVAGAISAGIATVLIAPMHHRVTHWAEHRFQKSLLRLRNGLPVLVGDLRETASLDQIARATLARIAEGVRARRLALLLDGNPIATRDVDADAVETWQAGWTPGDGAALDCDRDDPAFPLRIPLALEGDAPFGWILLGPRPDGSFYGKDEREALAEIADPVARAITIVSQRQTVETVQAQLTTGLSARIQHLEEAVARLLGHRPGIQAAE
jgi:hypothetical protein